MEKTIKKYFLIIFFLFCFSIKSADLEKKLNECENHYIAIIKQKDDQIENLKKINDDLIKKLDEYVTKFNEVQLKLIQFSERLNSLNNDE